MTIAFSADTILVAHEGLNIRKPRDCTLTDAIFDVHLFFSEVHYLFSLSMRLPQERIVADAIFFNWRDNNILRVLSRHSSGALLFLLEVTEDDEDAISRKVEIPKELAGSLFVSQGVRFYLYFLDLKI
jgi:hypothetical protein